MSRKTITCISTNGTKYWKYPDMNISVIPGIVSMFTFASKVGVSIAEGAEKVAIIPSCYDLSSVKEIAKIESSGNPDSLRT